MIQTARPTTHYFARGKLWILGKGSRGAALPVEISAELMRDLRSFFSKEARAAYRAGDLCHSADAAGLWIEVKRALDALQTNVAPQCGVAPSVLTDQGDV